MITVFYPQSVRSGEVHQRGWGWPEPAGGGGRLQWPGGGHGSPAGCKGKTKYHRCHVWAPATNDRSSEGLWAGAARCGLQTVRSKNGCLVTSRSFTSTYSSFYFFQLRQNHCSCFFFASDNGPSLCSVLFLLAIHHLSLLPASLLSPSLISHSPYLSVSLSVYLQELPEKWNNVRKQAVLVKQQVAPLQAIEVTSLRRKCASFDVEQHTFREHFRNNGPFR